MYTKKMGKKQDIEKLRSYSTVFSSLSFFRLINKDDYSFIDKKIERYNPEFIGETYKSYIQYLYRVLSKSYRCEYIYKNLILNELLIKKYKIKDTIAINEYKVGSSIVDLAMFNGTSKAFEIKTELDSSKRLESQLNDYQKLFNECYIVTHEILAEKYLSDTNKAEIGIIVLYKKNNGLTLEEIRPAYKSSNIDEEILIRSLRTNEYKSIIKKYYGNIPDVNSFKMFEECLILMKEIPSDILQSLFLETIKKRQTNKTLFDSPKELKQICLSLNLNTSTYSLLDEKLSKTIII